MLRLARLLTIVAFLALCLASVVHTAVPAATRWHAERLRFQDASPLQARLYSALISLPTVNGFVFERMRQGLRPGDRYFIQMGLRRDQAAGGWIESYARYYLLPSLMVTRAKDADVVLSFHADPRRLDLHYSSVRRAAHDLVIARVDDGR